MGNEAIRLVIWDLDQTFWSGTLTEGGIEYRMDNHNTVIELARRGIVSSICSRNNFSDVEKLLRAKGIWEYFVFPSIDWSAKGPRLVELVNAVQLRAPTILFIDDNPMNLGEALHFIPEIQVADEKAIPGLLDNPLLRGKRDDALSRLKQYQLLEQRKREMVAVPDTAEFLRRSNIRVSIEFDVEGNIDRAVELINRTNQLNFTKIRLPEESAQARESLLSLLNQAGIQAGLVRVRDRYGDYGFTGLYVLQKTVHAGSGLIHFCFSCRTMGMGIESWLYRLLDRPPIRIVGEVLSDIMSDSPSVDWIQLEQSHSTTDNLPQTAIRNSRRFLVRGGCELMAVAHYLRAIASEVVGEYAFNRDHIQIRLEHSLFMRYALEGLTDLALASFNRLGFHPEDFHTTLTRGEGENDVWVLAFWADADYGVYRHKRLNVVIPFNAYPAVQTALLLESDPPPLDEAFNNHWIVGALKELRENYAFEGRIGEAAFKDNLRVLFDNVRASAKIFIIGCNETKIDSKGVRHAIQEHVDLNNWCREIARARRNATFLEIHSFLKSDDDIQDGDPNHFHRRVYYRIYEEIAGLTSAAKFDSFQPP